MYIKYLYKEHKTMEPVILFKNKYHIDLSSVDFAKKLRLSALFGYFQDIASMAVENLGIGIDTILEKFGVTWILMRIRVDIIRPPLWNEQITIETWPIESRKMQFDRDYVVRDEEENILARAVSTWVILDPNTKEIKKTSLISDNIPKIIKERAIDCKLGRFKSFGEMTVAYKKVIGYSDIDFNGHLNNSKYIDFIMDCFDFESHKKYSVKSIEVSYINEALPGDTITLYRDISALDSNLIYIEGVNEKDGKAVFKSQVEIFTL